MDLITRLLKAQSLTATDDVIAGEDSRQEAHKEQLKDYGFPEEQDEEKIATTKYSEIDNLDENDQPTHRKVPWTVNEAGDTIPYLDENGKNVSDKAVAKAFQKYFMFKEDPKDEGDFGRIDQLLSTIESEKGRENEERISPEEYLNDFTSFFNERYEDHNDMMREWKNDNIIPTLNDMFDEHEYGVDGVGHFDDSSRGPIFNPATDDRDAVKGLMQQHIKDAPKYDATAALYNKLLALPEQNEMHEQIGSTGYKTDPRTTPKGTPGKPSPTFAGASKPPAGSILSMRKGSIKDIVNKLRGKKESSTEPPTESPTYEPTVLGPRPEPSNPFGGGARWAAEQRVDKVRTSFPDLDMSKVTPEQMKNLQGHLGNEAYLESKDGGYLGVNTNEDGTFDMLSYIQPKPSSQFTATQEMKDKYPNDQFIQSRPTSSQKLLKAYAKYMMKANGDTSNTPKLPDFNPNDYKFDATGEFVSGPKDDVTEWDVQAQADAKKQGWQS